ncbi:MAG: hypothetical protein J07HX64_00212 [halophilic archaeon J07HX64]|nr:MAG: hypothetical protein J07HX64_00212 [halophilic archaeon J07HX64]
MMRVRPGAIPSTTSCINNTLVINRSTPAIGQGDTHVRCNRDDSLEGGVQVRLHLWWSKVIENDPGDRSDWLTDLFLFYS